MITGLITRVRQSQITQGIGSGIYHVSLFTVESIKKVAATVFFGYVGVGAGKMMGINMQDKIDLSVGGESLFHREGNETHIVGAVACALAMTAHYASLQLQRMQPGKVKQP